MRLALWFWIAALVVPRLGFADDAKIKSDAAELFNRAAIRQGIRRSGGKPYVLKIQFRADHIVPKPMHGQYEEVWISPDQWRREFVLSDFAQVETGSAEGKWVSRNLDFRPRPAYLLSIALDEFMEPKISPDETVASLRQRKHKDSEWRCVELTTASTNAKRELCFDDSGSLASEQYLDKRFEYENFENYGDKIFPRSIRVYSDKAMVLELTADEIVLPPEPKPELFRAQPGARQFASCERWPAIPTKKVPPHYPESARAAHQQGTVTVYAAVAADGQVGATRVLESGGLALDESTLDAVHQWVYPALNCGSRPLPAEIEIRVNYSLSFR